MNLNIHATIKRNIKTRNFDLSITYNYAKNLNNDNSYSYTVNYFEVSKELMEQIRKILRNKLLEDAKILAMYIIENTYENFLKLKNIIYGFENNNRDFCRACKFSYMTETSISSESEDKKINNEALKLLISGDDIDPLIISEHAEVEWG